MKAATIRPVRNDFETVLAWVEAGEEVTVRREPERRSKMEIEVTAKSPNEFLVILAGEGGGRRYTVTVSDGYHQRLTGGAENKESLVKRSFEFLLEREPKESILSSFDLTVIGRYFPEYERTIRK